MGPISPFSFCGYAGRVCCKAGNPTAYTINGCGDTRRGKPEKIAEGGTLMRRRAGLLLMLFIFSISPEAKAGLTDASLEIANLYDQSSSGLTSVSGYFVDPDVQMQSASDFNGGIITGLPGPYIPMTLVPFAGDPLELVATKTGCGKTRPSWGI